MGQWVASYHNNADEYVGSALPYAKSFVLKAGTTVNLKFPAVTKFIKIFNNTPEGGTETNLRMGFKAEDVLTAGTDSAPQNHLLVGPNTSTKELSIKCKEIYLRGAAAEDIEVSIIAGCTNIPVKNFPPFPFQKRDGSGEDIQIEFAEVVPPAPPPVIITDQTALLNALADPQIDVIQIDSEIVMDSPASIDDVGLLIDRPVTITGTGTIASAGGSNAPITFVKVAANDVTFEGITISHRRAAPSGGQIDRAVLVQAENFKALNVNVEFMEFGYWMEGQFEIQGGETIYTGPLENTHRHFGFYSITGDSIVKDLQFDFPFEAEPPRSTFALSNQGQPTRKFDGLLTLDNIKQKTVSTSFSNPAEYYYMSQFFVQQSFAQEVNRENMALAIKNCEWDDISGGIFVFGNGDNPLAVYNSIEISGNTQGIGTLIDSFVRAPVGDETDPLRYKGMFFLDGNPPTSTPPDPPPPLFQVGDLDNLNLNNNTVPTTDLRPGFEYPTVAGQQANVFAINTAVYQV
jgi:hypothetical protein